MTKTYFEGWFIPNKPLKKGEKFKIPKMSMENAVAFSSAFGAIRGGGILRGKKTTFQL